MAVVSNRPPPFSNDRRLAVNVRSIKFWRGRHFAVDMRSGTRTDRPLRGGLAGRRPRRRAASVRRLLGVRGRRQRVAPVDARPPPYACLRDRAANTHTRCSQCFSLSLTSPQEAKPGPRALWNWISEVRLSPDRRQQSSTHALTVSETSPVPLDVPATELMGDIQLASPSPP